MRHGASQRLTYDFGAQGWGVIVMEGVLLFFMTGLTVDGLNIIVPSMAAFRGWNPDVLLSISTPASIVALMLVTFWGGFQKRWGLKRVTVVTMLLAGLACALYGNAQSVIMYAVSLVLMITFISAFALNCGFAICANWFPRRKGIVMGLVTIGMNLASALINLILNALVGLFDISMALSMMGLAIVLCGIAVELFIKETPEEAGCFPDNDPAYACALHEEERALSELPSLTYKEALRDKRIWLTGLAYGCFGLATVGIMSQLVDYFQAVKGMTIDAALLTVTGAAVIGMVGSWLWGIVDQAIGTRRVSLIFGIWYCIGILLMMLPTTPTFVVGLVMLGAAIGGNGNFPPSMIGQLFSRRDFGVAFSVMNLIVGVVRSCSFLVLALLRSVSAGYTVPYLVFAGLSLVGGCAFAAARRFEPRDASSGTRRRVDAAVPAQSETCSMQTRN